MCNASSQCYCSQLIDIFFNEVLLQHFARDQDSQHIKDMGIIVFRRKSGYKVIFWWLCCYETYEMQNNINARHVAEYLSLMFVNVRESS